MSTTVLFDGYGGTDRLYVADERLPAPGPGQVLLRNRAIGVNPIDWRVLAGDLASRLPLDLPAVLGNESAGVVEALGEGVAGTELAVGEAVIRHGMTGSYRELEIVPAAELVVKPRAVSFEQAAVLPVAAGTAYSAAVQVGVGPGDTVLVAAAAGGVGSAAVQIARSLGARVIGTAAERNHDYLRSIGAEPVDYEDGPEAVTARIRELGPVDAVLDFAGTRASLACALAVVADESRAVTAAVNAEALQSGVAIVRHREDELERVLALAASGDLVLEIAGRYPLAEAGEALVRSRAGHVRGKLVLTV